MAGIGGFTMNVAFGTHFTSVAQISTASLPELTKTDIDVSSMDSVENFMEFIGGATDPGQLDIELNYTSAMDVSILTAFNAANADVVITFSDASTWTSDAYINKMGGGTSGTNEKISRTLGFKCSGKPTQG